MVTGKKIRVAAYIRVSTDSADQENSYETQERYFQNMLSQNDEWISGGIYADCGLSGTNQAKRTGFKRILRHCREGKIDRIVCKSISRFARNTEDFMMALVALRESGATIFFEKENLDTADSASDFIFTTLGAVAQEESRSISENIHWGIQKRYPNGEVGNVKIYGYQFADGEDSYLTVGNGYRMRKIVIVEEEAEVVRRIFAEAVCGKSFTEIARGLNYDRIPAPDYTCTRRSKRMREGKPAGRGELKDGIDQGWTAKNISRILRLERYAGDVLLQKTYTADYLTHQVRRNRGEMAQYLVKNHHPAIISRELFEKAKSICQYNCDRYERPGQTAEYPFTKRLVCAHCGRFYHLRNTHRNPIWFCPSTALNNGKIICHGPKVYEKQIAEMLRKAVIDRFRTLAVPARRNMNISDIVGGRSRGKEEFPFYWFSEEADHFMEQMIKRLENMQQTDYVERDRAFLRRKILETQRNRGQSGSQERKRELEQEEKQLKGRLAYLEEYWEELEKDYDWRERGIRWMKGLPGGKAGLTAFLDGITGDYVKAFVLDITVHSQQDFTVHWFDDTRTDVKMNFDIGEF